MKKFSLPQLTRAALIAALYSALTIPLGAISSQSFLQIRPAEALTMLPLLFAEAVPGLAIGCMIANIFGGYGIYDIIFGSLITLTAALLTRKIKKPLIAGLPPVLLNAALLPLIWIAFSAETIYLYSFFSTLL
ncbi:MAG: QueT transporter family protein, partial [Clostridia bacterium]|nr:QueT transporter family protein [Clostridia bacterium]